MSTIDTIKCTSSSSMRDWFLKLSTEQQMQLLVFGKQCLRVHNVLTPLETNCFDDALTLSDGDARALILSILQKSMKGAEFTMRRQTHTIVVQNGKFMCAVHIHNNHTLTHQELKTFEQTLKIDEVYSNIWVFVHDVSVPGLTYPVGVRRTRPLPPYTVITGVRKHPDRLSSVLQLLAGDLHPAATIQTERLPRQSPHPSTEYIDKAVRQQMDVENILELLKRRVSACVDTLNTARQYTKITERSKHTTSEFVSNVPLVFDKMEKLRSNLHTAWDSLQDEGVNLNVRETCKRLLRMFPGEYVSFKKENNFRNRLRYYGTNFKQEKGLYLSISTFSSKKPKLNHQDTIE